MTYFTPMRCERLIAAAGIAAGCLISVMLAPKDGLFLPNFAFYWGGQLAVLVVLCLMRPRAATVAALAFVLATILLCLHRWIMLRPGGQHDGLVWLLYPVLLSGAAVGAMVAVWWRSGEGSVSGWRIAWTSGLAALAATALSAAAACNTVFYCR